jgi:DNA (cytosine-5)-methyltransferase 1
MFDGRPRAIDLCCGAGGATRGLQLAGFHVTGVDINPQPNYCGDDFIRADIKDIGTRGCPIWLPGYTFGWVSPPCERFSWLTPTAYRGRHADLITWARVLMRVHKLPYVIENVAGARHMLESPLMLCGSMFGLRVWRHRYFETNVPVNRMLPPCNHSFLPVVVSGSPRRRRGDGTLDRSEPSTQERRDAMEIPWMRRVELDKAIPPKFSEFLGREAMDYLKTESEPVA